MVNLRDKTRAKRGDRIRFHDEWPSATGTVTAFSPVDDHLFVRWDDDAPERFVDGWYAAESLDRHKANEAGSSDA